ncbi:amine oxidase [Hyaloraphidium curvatum]|nr:amine oxidase [Hyaloraphidium curvatum]
MARLSPLLALLLALPSAYAQALPRCIVGAGVAGLSAGDYLVSNGGDRPVRVFEARDRVGGRVWSDTSLGYYIDLGAGWIQGAYPRNPLLSLLRENSSVQTVATDFEGTQTMDMATGAPVPEATVTRITQQYNAAIAQVYERQPALTEATDISLQAQLDSILTGATATRRNDVFWQATAAVGNEYAVDLDWLSAKYFGIEAEERGEALIFRNGYVNLFNGMVSRLNISLSTPISAVTLANGVPTITTAAGEQVECHQILVTIPLGMLKAGNITFNPPLSSAKTNAITKMGYGVLDKVVLDFPAGSAVPAAIRDRDVFRLYTTDVAGETRKFYEWLNYRRVVPTANSLVCLISGSFAEQAENRTDAEVAADALSALRSAFPDDTLPAADQIRVRVTRWRNDPWSRGSYSHLGVGSNPTMYGTLGQPVDGWLFFAGEHTNRTFPALVHGALGSGVRAAKEMLATQPPVVPTATGGASTTGAATTGTPSPTTATASPTTSRPSGAGSLAVWMGSVAIGLVSGFTGLSML